MVTIEFFFMFPHTAYSSFSRVRSMLWWSWSWYNLLTIGGTIVTLYIINLTASMLITTCFLQTKWCFIFRCFQIFILIHIPSGFSMFVIYSSHIISYILWCNIILLVASLGNQIDACYSARTIFLHVSMFYLFMSCRIYIHASCLQCLSSTPMVMVKLGNTST
jgi:hypothetical protein